MRVYGLLVGLLVAVTGTAQKGFVLKENKASKKTEVWFDGKMVTAYCYFDSTEKPVLFPVRTLSGITVTRGYPVAPRAGERTDHPHHLGLWLNYESVNGLDFWNNSDAIAADRKPKYGSIRHQKIIGARTTRDNAVIKTLSHWVDTEKNVLLEETTSYVFSREGAGLVIDRDTELRAVQDTVRFMDVKDGMVAIRVARELELPSREKSKFVDSHGKVTEVDPSGDAATGMYENKEGLKGDEVWGKRSVWTSLTGKKDGRAIAILIIDHPQNIGYPTYWHARGYGLFAANPLGQKIFSQGREELNLSLRKGKSVRFRYRILVYEGPGFTRDYIESLVKDFHTVKP